MKHHGLAAVALATACVLGGCEGMGVEGDSLFPDIEKLKKEGLHTVLLAEFYDPELHRQHAERYKANTARHAGWKGLFVVSDKKRSTLYWGRYATREDAQERLKAAKRYQAPSGQKIYQVAYVTIVPTADVGPEPWRLENAPGTYSVLVAVFSDKPEANYIGRKHFAVLYCKQLRGRGLPAYYYHGARRSGVTVGGFPRSAIRVSYAGPIRKSTIVDGRMQRTIDRFEYLAVDGRKERVITPIATRHTIHFDPNEDETTRKRKLEGKAVGHQRPYPVRIPGRKPTHGRAKDDRPGDAKPRQDSGDPTGPS